MARVIVIGAGLGGLAAAARIAKLGHQVTICERRDRIGGVLGTIEADGFRWDAAAASTTLPATLRDLFRKSGRPLEQVAQLDPIQEPRRHLFTDGTVLDLPLTDRAGQLDAWRDLAGEKASLEWTDLVDSYGETWQLLRKNALEAPLPDKGSFGAWRALRPWQSLEKVGRRKLSDERAREVLAFHATVHGSEPSKTPGYFGVGTYLERTFGRWTFDEGFAVLVDALGKRLAERKVEVRLGVDVAGVLTADGVVTGVRLADGTEVPTDLVVSDIDPRELFEHLVVDPAAKKERKRILSTHLAESQYVVHLGLREPLPELPFETVLHGDPPVLIRRAGDAPPGHQAWSVLVHGYPSDDVVDLLVARGLPIRDHVVSRQTSGSWWTGIAWEGARTASRRAKNVTGVKGLYCVGAGAHPGGGVPAVVLGAAIVADAVGKA